MFHDIDNMLRKKLSEILDIQESSINISFDLLDENWNSRPTKPTIHLFLYDIRENRELRSNERLGAFHENRTSRTIITKPPVYMDLAYMITVWANDINNEHELLGNILQGLLLHPTLKNPISQELQEPIHTQVAQPEKTPNAWDFWGSLSGRMKTGISYVLTVPIQPSANKNKKVSLPTTVQTEVMVKTNIEIKEENEKIEARTLVIRQLKQKYKLEEIPSEIETRINKLSKTNLERLAENLLDFNTIEDLKNWLNNILTEQSSI